MPRERLTVVEFGMGNMPFLNPDNRFSGRAIKYIGIDNGSSGFKSADNNFANARAVLDLIPGIEYELVEGDANSTLLPSHSVDLVHISNMFGDPYIPGDKMGLLREAARIMREDGKLRVIDTYTPFRYPLDVLVSRAQAVGLVQIDKGDEQKFSRVKKYLEDFWNEKDMDPDYYIAEFRPVTEVARRYQTPSLSITNE